MDHANDMADRLSKFEIRVGLDQDDFENNLLCTYRDPAIPRGAPVMVECDTPVCGRYVSIQRMDSSPAPLTICEATVMGEGEFSYILLKV